MKSSILSKISFVFFFIFGLNSTFLKAQNINLESSYFPSCNYKMDSVEFYNLLKRYDVACKEFCKKKPSKSKSYIKSETKLLKKHLIELNRKNLLMYNDTLSKYLNSILDKIISANANLINDEYKIFCYRTIVPNASSWDEGIILFNIDLLSKLKQESEIADVICHEIAHDKLEHNKKNTETEIQILFDKEAVKKIKKTSKQVYNKITMMENLNRSFLAKINSYSRKFEFEADSLGFIFYKNAGYKQEDSYQLNLKLDSIDEILFSETQNVIQKLNHNISSKNSLNVEDSSNLNWKGNYVFEIPDSLKTHPDCILRAEKIKSYFDPSIKIEFSGKNEILNSSTFEYIQYLIDSKMFGLALYYSLAFQDEFPENDYLKLTSVDCLLSISESLVNHNFSKSVDLPSNSNPPAYDELLRFLNNSNSRELNNLAEKYYTQNILNKNITNIDYLKYIQLKFELLKLTDLKIKQTKISDYLKNNPDSFYAQKLNIKKK